MNNEQPSKWEADLEAAQAKLNDAITQVLMKDAVYERLSLIEEDIENRHPHLIQTLRMIKKRIQHMRDAIQSDVQYNLEDAEEYTRDIYAYHGVKRSDF